MDQHLDLCFSLCDVNGKTSNQTRSQTEAEGSKKTHHCNFTEIYMINLIFAYLFDFSLRALTDMHFTPKNLIHLLYTFAKIDLLSIHEDLFILKNLVGFDISA